MRLHTLTASIPLGLALALAACAGPPPDPRGAPPLARSAPPPAAPAPPSSSAAASPPPLDPAVEKALAELEHHADPLSTYLVRDPPPVRGFAPIPAKRGGRFPGVAYTEVRGYAYRFVRPQLQLDGDARCGSEQPGVLTSKGTLCPTVVAPGVTLTEEQAARLVAIAVQPDPEVQRMVTRCEFDPHHAFVFHDARGVPVAEMLVCFSCGQWVLRPAPQGIAELMGKHEPELRRLCEELGLGGCAIGDDAFMEKVSEARRARREQASPVRALGLPAALEIDGTTPLKDLSPRQRRTTCILMAEHLLSHSMFRPTSGFECAKDSRPGQFSLPWECPERFPSCDVAVGRVDACWPRFVEDPCGEQPETRAACEGLDECLPGFRWRQPAARPGR